MEKVSPTRMNLLSRKSQLGLAGEGMELLKQKREVLLRQFMELVKPLSEKRRQLHEEIVRAFHCLNTARAIDGLENLKAAALLTDARVTVEIRKVINWGVAFPLIDSVDGLNGQGEANNSYGMSLRIFETRDRFQKAVRLVLEIAPLEAALKRLGREIKKTTRRINALDLLLIPRLRGEIRYIRTTLDEREREDNFRLRRIIGTK